MSREQATQKIEKVIRNGMVAVLYSPGFGAGWYSWNSNYPQILFHPKLIEMVEAGRQKEITEEFMLSTIGVENIYCGGAEDLEIAWLPEGTAFEIDDYDGSESIRTLENLNLIA